MIKFLNDSQIQIFQFLTQFVFFTAFMLCYTQEDANAEGNVFFQVQFRRTSVFIYYINFLFASFCVS